MNIPRREFLLGTGAALVPSVAEDPKPKPLASILHICVGSEGFEADPKKIEAVVDALRTAMKKGGDQVLFTGPEVSMRLLDVTNIDGILAIVKEEEQ